ncbi:hypothetical protein HRbin04_00319 [archaeon HR04]|jgi:hypothetical protein|nr:hypothetical protein HRbin04_00319 [archaeon HR04]
MVVMIVKCNICNIEIDDAIVDEHVGSDEHKANLERIKGMMRDKVYDEDSTRLGIDA